MQTAPYSLSNIVSFAANSFTIVVSVIAIIVFVAKRKSISAALRLLLNYSFHMTLSELTSKLDRLVDLRAEDTQQKQEIICLLNEIVGQIRGNKKLCATCENLMKRLTKYTKNPDRINDPTTRSYVSELRETLKHINLEDYDSVLGDNE